MIKIHKIYCLMLYGIIISNNIDKVNSINHNKKQIYIIFLFIITKKSVTHFYSEHLKLKYVFKMSLLDEAKYKCYNY